MQIIYEEPELALPFAIRSDPRRRHEPDPEPLDAFTDRLLWLATGYVSVILIIAVAGLFL